MQKGPFVRLGPFCCFFAIDCPGIVPGIPALARGDCPQNVPFGPEHPSRQIPLSAHRLTIEKKEKGDPPCNVAT